MNAKAGNHVPGFFCPLVAFAAVAGMFFRAIRVRPGDFGIPE
jgi:hypothetical protein